MNMREALVAALRRDPDLLPKVKSSLRARIGDEEGAMRTVIQAAGALEPVIEDAVRKKPSKLGLFGLRSAHVLASLAVEDAKSNRRLERIARGGTVGIVFADVAGFTTYTATHGDEAASRVLARLERLIDGCIAPLKGECVKRLGDGFLLAFPSASQAVRAAVSIRDAVEGRNLSDDAAPLRMRLAVHAGEPLVEADDLLGHDVNVTARLLDDCRPGEVVVSEVAKELAEKRLRKIGFGLRREAKIRGLALRVPIYSADPRSSV